MESIRICTAVSKAARLNSAIRSLTRISDRGGINVSAGGGLLPSVVGRHKRRLLAEDDPGEGEMVHGSP